jgi:hypothetical protein
MRRLIAILLVALLAAPGTWVRSPPPPMPDVAPPDGRWPARFEPIDRVRAHAGETEIVGAWWVTSPYPGFGSFSALVSLGGDRLLAASDAGRMFAFSAPGAAQAPPRMDFFAGRSEPNKFLVDIEALTRNPRSGQIWAAYEGANSIERFGAGFRSTGLVRPAAMRGWPGNTGPETLLRLADGRFLVISEAHASWRGGPFTALLFPGDPVDGAEPVEFRFEGIGRLRPVDAAQLPDGRVLVLLRSFHVFPPGFENRIVVADPAEIAAGRVWRGREIAAIGAPLPSDNFEGLAITPAADGKIDLWLISDDNFSVIQRTLVLQLRWEPD